MRNNLHPMARSSHVLAVFLTFLPALAAQCATQWASGSAVPGVNGPVTAITAWDPDGPGPQTLRIVVGGTFGAAGSTPAAKVAAFDPATGAWTAIGNGIPGDGGVLALAALPNGGLVAAGIFQVAGGAPADGIARWNGSSWVGMGAIDSIGMLVSELRTMPNGDLVAAGSFGPGNGLVGNGLARWNGASWAALGTAAGFNSTGLAVESMAGLPNGDLVICGSYGTVGAVNSPLARWNGSAWSALPGVPTTAAIRELAVEANGNLVVGGQFASIGGVAANNVARWNGTAWSALGAGLAANSLLAAASSGELLAMAGPALGDLRRWNGSAWTSPSIATPTSEFVRAMVALPGGEVFAGGDFVASITPSVAATGVARWTGSAWQATTSGGSVAGVVHAAAALPNGNVVVGGKFNAIGGMPASGIAIGAGSQWSTLGTAASPGVDVGSTVLAVAALANGDIVAGGNFSSIGGVAAGRIARLSGATWSSMGGANSNVNALMTLANGDLIAAGGFTSIGGVVANGIARWNGSAWSALGAGVGGGEVLAVAAMPNGNLVAGGSFTTAGGVAANRVARWNGSSWSALGVGANGTISALAALPNGDLVVGGEFTVAGGLTVNRIARWNGVTWSAFGAGANGSVDALTTLPDGGLVAGGAFTSIGGVAAGRLARWNGAAWSAFAGGVNDRVRALAFNSLGSVVVGGNFTTTGGQFAAGYNSASTTCAALVANAGAACPGAGGSNLFFARTRPWMGTTYATRGIGLAPVGFVVVVYGFSPILLPLNTVMATFPVGCNLYTTPDVMDVLLSNNGTVDVAVAIPNAPSLIGFVLREQLVVHQVDANLNFVQSTSSNALVATIGTF